jgi:hypothetical protein
MPRAPDSRVPDVDVDANVVEDVDDNGTKEGEAALACQTPNRCPS